MDFPPTPAVESFDDCVCQTGICAVECQYACAGDGIDKECPACVTDAAGSACMTAFLMCPDAAANECAPTCGQVSVGPIGLSPGYGTVCETTGPAFEAFQAYIACATQSCASECAFLIVQQRWPTTPCMACMNANCAAATMACDQN
jgi:hypothetical protein